MGSTPVCFPVMRRWKCLGMKRLSQPSSTLSRLAHKSSFWARSASERKLGLFPLQRNTSSDVILARTSQDAACSAACQTVKILFAPRDIDQWFGNGMEEENTPTKTFIGGVTISRLPYVFVPLFPDSRPLLCFSRYHVNHAVWLPIQILKGSALAS